MVRRLRRVALQVEALPQLALVQVLKLKGAGCARLAGQAHFAGPVAHTLRSNRKPKSTQENQRQVCARSISTRPIPIRWFCLISTTFYSPLHWVIFANVSNPSPNALETLLLATPKPLLRLPCENQESRTG